MDAMRVRAQAAREAYGYESSPKDSLRETLQQTVAQHGAKTAQPEASHHGPEGPVPTTWREAVPYVVWGFGVLGFVLEFIAALVHRDWTSLFISGVGGLGLMALALHWKQIKSWAATISPNWVVAVFALLLQAVLMMPFIEQQRWPFSAEISAAPIPPLSHSNDAGPKIYTRKTIHDLVALYEGRTAMQAEAFMADEKGKWISTDGKVQLVSPNGFVLLFDNYVPIQCRFDAKWKAKLGAFRPSEDMKIVGRIGPDQNGAIIDLRECELRD